ncbi:uncharacterized protein LOC120253489 [Dioscorea cayenensis subsp. rotundata]|uniref:Uncharacterized protein LOC120253489 n=1 Tax=Dioscorea cayennensis subsp. rotundata TaxID=55577 RepID=A0AB40AS35_DIOCR|nr:uncharacterized protein LOC120253489 [Dioscorea cayenensis subsp. rotundata]
MANHLARPPPSATSPLPISSPTTPKKPHFLIPNLHHRRTFTNSLIGVATVMFIGAESAKAAARRPPPPSPEEKIDPNVSGVTAKVLASKKRKEAMKAEIAKLREKGKVIE